MSALRFLRDCAGAAGDVEQVAICDLAILGEVDPDHMAMLDAPQQRRVRRMTRSQALTICEAEIAAADRE